MLLGISWIDEIKEFGDGNFASLVKVAEAGGALSWYE